jgi:uncharacterized membrane protein YphA (DoxX/SURF4 family)
MGSAILAARVVLAGVFATAGAGKLLDLNESRRSLVGFGVSESLATFGGTLLPIVELATAVGLIVRPTAIWAAGAALAQLVVFIGAIANALRQGKAPDCNCFGSLHSAPAGRKQIVRNVVLGAIAVFVIARGTGPAVDDWITARTAAELVSVALGLAALGLAAAVYSYWRQTRRLQTDLDHFRRIADAVPPGLPIGSPAPVFTLKDRAGEPVTLDALRARGVPIALIFAVPGSGVCSTVIEELPRWTAALGSTLAIGEIGVGAYLRFEAARTRTGAPTLTDVYEHDEELATEYNDLVQVLGAYRVHATPSAVLVTPEGTIASATVDGRPAVEALLRLASERRGAGGLAVGHPIASY